MATFNRFKNTAYPYDFAIDGNPFVRTDGENTPYARYTSDYKKEQIDTSGEPGENSFSGSWYRSQSSFHLGAGIKFFDTLKDKTIVNRFSDSVGVDSLTEEGQTTLIKSTVLAGQDNNDGIQKVVGYAVAGSNGCIWAHGNQLTDVDSSNNAGGSNIGWGGSSNIRDIATNGSSYFVLANDGIYGGSLPDGAGIKMYGPTVSRGVIGWAKDRLIACVNEKVYELPLVGETTALPEVLYDHKIDGWNWTAIADGPDSVYMTGYSGDRSVIYRVRLADDGLKLLPPSITGELPRGEIVTSMIIYQGSYMILGTNLGVRVCAITNNGTIVIGPLSIETNGVVGAVYARGNFVYAGGSNSDGRVGTYRLDLSRQISDNNFQFAYQRYIYSDASWGGGRDIKSISMLGLSNRLVFVVSNWGLIKEHSTQYVVSGWIETGGIRFDTMEQKRFNFIKVQARPTGTQGDGTLSVQWRDEFNELTSTPLLTMDTGKVAEVNQIGSDENTHQYVAYRFTLKPNTARTKTPIFTSYQVMAKPSSVKQRVIKITAALTINMNNSDGRAVHVDTWDKIKKLEDLDENGRVVLYQDLNTGEERLVTIDKIEYQQTQLGTTGETRANPSGLIAITMVTEDGGMNDVQG